MTRRSLQERIKTKRIKVGIIGLGYVGLPLAVAFAKKGFTTYGIDVDRKRVARLRRGESYILDLSPSEITTAIKEQRLVITDDLSHARKLDAVIICVPTPLRKTKEPDISFIISAVENIKAHLRRGQLIVLESTTYPGTTREVILPIISRGGFAEGKDFYLAFSPERIDPGNAKYQVTNIPKIVGGVSKASTMLAALLYEQVVESVLLVSSSEVAEMAKLLENTFRIVNIGLVNELAIMCHKLNINVWEVIEAAKTKPYGFMPFYPGPGVGGHCIPIDPIYLSWKARQYGFEARFINLASEVNAEMPYYVVGRVAEELKKEGKELAGAKILILGVAYKKDVKDLRESPALEIIELLKRSHARVCYYDPLFPYLKIDGIELCRSPYTARAVRSYDCVIIVTDHTMVNYDLLRAHARLVMDTRNALGGSGSKAKVLAI